MFNAIKGSATPFTPAPGQNYKKGWAAEDLHLTVTSMGDFRLYCIYALLIKLVDPVGTSPHS